MADFEERHLKISFDELNTKLNNCIQKILKASFMENKDSVNDFEICLNEYSQLRKDFQEQGFCYDENLCGHFDKEAEENVQLRKLAFDIIKEKLQLLYENPEIKARKRIVELLWQFREQVELTMPFKIWALSPHTSALPYSVSEEDFKERAYWSSSKKKEIKWHFVGFAENIFEAWYYVQQNTCSGINPEMGGEHVCHVLSDPADEGFNGFAKIESEYYTDYFDVYAPSPLGQHFGYRKTEAVCFFCSKRFEGKGKDIYPINYMSDRSYIFNRACDECHKKFVEPIRQNKRPRMTKEEKTERENKLTGLRIKYFLEKPKFEEEGKSK
ncbi:MAG: hypothetical protein MR970_11130 [Spirochaetia bacterium]|nr:hypothetical protein [Spirochaetia bacterium]